MTNTSSPERTIPFTMVYNAVLDRDDLNPFEVMLYVAIARHVNRESGLAWPSYTRLQQTAHMCRQSVSKYLKSLESKGLIEIIRRQRPGTRARAVNHYRLLVPVEPQPGSLRPDQAAYKGSLSDKSEIVYAADQDSLPDQPGVVYAADGNEIEENKKNNNIQTNHREAATPPAAPDGAPPLDQFIQDKKKDSWGNFCHTLAEVCHLDYAANKAKIRRVANILWRDGRGYSSADLRTFETWWYKHDWRGKKGDVPRLDEVVQTIRIAVEERPRMSSSGDRYRYITGKYADIVKY
ncbi:MAG: helix-turn-helix domain-containing protein [Anaerolineae bacterium]